MSDMKIAHIGRELVLYLNRFARDRDPDSKKMLAELHTRLCAAVRTEAADDAQAAVSAPAEQQHELQL